MWAPQGPPPELRGGLSHSQPDGGGVGGLQGLLPPGGEGPNQDSNLLCPSPTSSAMDWGLGGGLIQYVQVLDAHPRAQNSGLRPRFCSLTPKVPPGPQQAPGELGCSPIE